MDSVMPNIAASQKSAAFSLVLERALSSAFHRAGGRSSIALRWSSIAC